MNANQTNPFAHRDAQLTVANLALKKVATHKPLNELSPSDTCCVVAVEVDV